MAKIASMTDRELRDALKAEVAHWRRNRNWLGRRRWRSHGKPLETEIARRAERRRASNTEGR